MAFAIPTNSNEIAANAAIITKRLSGFMFADSYNTERAIIAANTIETATVNIVTVFATFINDSVTDFPFFSVSFGSSLSLSFPSLSLPPKRLLIVELSFVKPFEIAPIPAPLNNPAINPLTSPATIAGPRNIARPPSMILVICG